jgi:acyl carrier protein
MLLRTPEQSARFRPHRKEERPTVGHQGKSMTDTSIYERLTPLFRDVFDDDRIVATPELTAHKVGGWDSLSNVRLMVEIERAFSVHFSAMEITSLKNVGQLADLIERKIHRSEP